MHSLIRRHSLTVGCLCIIVTVMILAGSGTSVLTLSFLAVALASILLISLSFFKFAYFLRPYRRTVSVSAVCTLLAILSCFYFIESANKPLRSLVGDQTPHQITGYATQDSGQGTYGTTMVTVTSLDKKSCDFRLLLLRTDTAGPAPYRSFEAEIVFTEDDELLSRYRDENVAYCANVLSLTPSQNSVTSIGAFFYSISSRIQESLYTHLDSETASFACALLLGQREGLSTELQRDFRTLGISHALAVSGLHLSVLTAALLFLLGILRVGRKTRAVIASLFMIFFAGLCGFSPSVLRAALMSIGLLAANAAGERTSGLHTLCIALAGILLFSPYLVFSISLQLSALATLGILVLYPLFVGKQPKRKKSAFFAKSLRFFFCQCALTVAATVFTLPVLYQHFGAVSISSLFANILFVPLITLMLYLLPIFLLLIFVPGVSSIIGYAVTGLYGWIRFLSGMARYCKDLYCYLPLWVLILIIVLLLTVPILCLAKRGKFAPVSVGLLVLCLITCYPASLSGGERMQCSYHNNRQTMLLADQNDVVLIETGNASKQNAEEALRESLDGLHQTGIDTVILTHYHNASVSFVEYLCQNTYPDTIYLPKPQNQSEEAVKNAIKTLADQRKVHVSCYGFDDRITVSDFELLVHQEHLHRAEHPAQAIEIKCQNGRVVAADPCLFELDGIGAVDLTYVDHLIFIDSAPIDKYPLPSFKGADSVHALYVSEKQFATVGCPFDRYTVLGTQRCRALIRFQNNT